MNERNLDPNAPLSEEDARRLEEMSRANHEKGLYEGQDPNDPKIYTGAEEAAKSREERPLIPENADPIAMGLGNSGVDTADQSVHQNTSGGGPDVSAYPKDDSGIMAEDELAITDDLGVAIDGGHLPGRKDTFEDELNVRIKRVEGAGDQANTGMHAKRPQDNVSLE